MAIKTRSDIHEDALEVLRKYKRAGAEITMGGGKTRLGLEHFQLVVNKIQKTEGRMAKGLVVAPLNKILRGWEEEAHKCGKTHLVDGLSFSTYRSLTKQDLDYDVVYLDECHSLLYSHTVWLNNFKGYIIGLTGTAPVREKSEKYRMVDTYCPIVFTYYTDEAVEDDILNDYRIIVHLLPLGDQSDYKITSGGRVWYTSEQESYNYWTDACNEACNPGDLKKASLMRMRAMKAFPSKERYARKLLNECENQCILFANTKEQADRLCTHSFHSGNRNSEANLKLFEEGKINELSCVDQISQGANIRNLKELIIMHAHGNNRTAPQKIGRGFRLEPGEVATIHVLCFKDTVDVEWVGRALEAFDQSKIDFYDTELF